MHDIYSPGFTWLEIVHPLGNKKDALLTLQKMLHIEKIVCFGDKLDWQPKI